MRDDWKQSCKFAPGRAPISGERTFLPLTYGHAADVSDSAVFIADLMFCFSGASRKDQPSFTLKQVSYLCERLLKDHEEKIREEYEQILNTKLAGKQRSSLDINKTGGFIFTFIFHLDSMFLQSGGDVQLNVQ